MQNNIKNFTVEKLEEGKFLKAKLARYIQNGKQKTWELLKTYDSVAILIYDKDKDAFVLVKQFRPAVYMNNTTGMTIELCAGIIDKDLSLKEIAKEEVEEECGYKVELENIEKITSFHSSVGISGSKQNLYYVEVDKSMRVSDGGGIDDEEIEVIFLPREKAKAFIFDENYVITSGLMFAFLWWIENKSNSHKANKA